MNLPEYITLNGTRYTSARLSEGAKDQIANIQAVDAEIARLNQRLAIAQTARNAYTSALIAEVKGAKAEASEAAAAKKPRAKKKAAAKTPSEK